MENLWLDIRFALRSLVRHPGFAVAAIFTLAFGFGTTVSVFSVVNGVLLQPLPYPTADGLLSVSSENQKQGWTRSSVSNPDLADIRFLQSVDFAEGYVPSRFLLPFDERVLSVDGAYVTGGLLDGFGLSPAFGRDIRQEENHPSAAPVVLLGYSLWRSIFGEDPGILGSLIQIDDQRFEVVGIAPDGFDFPGGSTLWIPHRHPCFGTRGCRNLYAVGRLSAGASLDQAQSSLTALSLSLRGEFPETNSDLGFRLEPLREVMVGEVQQGLWILFGAVSLMLLGVCANLANLLFARADDRSGEVAVRTAIGASPRRLMSQIMTETLVMVGVGGGTGAFLAAVFLRGFKVLDESSFPRAAEVGADANVILFALATLGVVAVVVGFAPALSLTRRSAWRGRGGHGNPVRKKPVGTFRFWLLVGEVALSVVLMAGMGLLLSSLTQLYRVDQGFEHRDVIRFNLSLPPGAFPSPSALVSLVSEVEEQLQTLPGVSDVGSVVGPPLSRRPSSGDVHVLGQAEPDGGDVNYASLHAATPGFFSTLGLPINKGRGLQVEDITGGVTVAVVNERFARENFPHQDPIGGRFWVAVATGAGKAWTIVGVVPDTRSTLTGNPEPEVFVPLAQAVSNVEFVQQDLTRELGSVTFLLRGATSAAGLEPLIRDRIQEVHPGLIPIGVETIEQVIRRGAAPTRYQLRLMGLFAALTLVLAGVGLYGVVSYVASQRRREIGIRLALGAKPGEIVRMVMGQGIMPAIAGLVLGLLATMAAGKVIESILFQVKPTDPEVLLAVAFLTLVLALGAVLIPALRAGRSDPVRSLRVYW